MINSVSGLDDPFFLLKTYDIERYMWLIQVAMVIKEPLKINAAQPDKLKIILPQPLIISNPTSLNKDFYFNYHRQLNYQVPEIFSYQHIIGISPQSFHASFQIKSKSLRWLGANYNLQIL